MSHRVHERAIMSELTYGDYVRYLEDVPRSVRNHLSGMNSRRKVGDGHIEYSVTYDLHGSIVHELFDTLGESAMVNMGDYEWDLPLDRAYVLIKGEPIMLGYWRITATLAICDEYTEPDVFGEMPAEVRAIIDSPAYERTVTQGSQVYGEGPRLIRIYAPGGFDSQTRCGLTQAMEKRGLNMYETRSPYYYRAAGKPGAWLVQFYIKGSDIDGETGVGDVLRVLYRPYNAS